MSFLGVRLRRRLAVSLAIVCLAVGATTGVAAASPANISHGSHVSHFVCDYICFAPYVVIEDTNGSIVTTFMGVGLVPLARYQITLTLSVSCQNNLDGLILSADLNGRINAPVYAGPDFFHGSQPCAPTRFYGFAQLLQTPYTTFAHYLKILPPQP